MADEASNSQKYSITTAIDYPNAPPHIGHALEKVAADVIARYHRLLGHDTYFSIGLDENSQHVVHAARANGLDPLAWVQKMDEAFRLAKRCVSSHYCLRLFCQRQATAFLPNWAKTKECVQMPGYMIPPGDTTP